MEKAFYLTFCTLFGIYCSAQAQIFIELDNIQPPAEVIELYDQPVVSDEYSDGHIIWAPKGFKKIRHGAPVYEQIFVLEGSALFSFEKEEKEVVRGSWIIIPANTPHTIEVLSDKPLKILAIQEKK